MRTAATLLVLFGFVTGVDAQTPAMGEADAHFQAERWDAAAAIYERVLAADSTVAMAWYRLGRVRHAQQRYEEAIPLFERAATAGVPPGYVRFAVARAYVALERPDAALDELEALAEGGFAVHDALVGDPDLAPLSGHPRMARILDRVARNAAPCEHMEEARQFDFWVGHWSVHEPGSMRQLGENRVERALKGCVLLENWTGAGGSDGKSMNFFDPVGRTWRQLWVSDRGNILDYTRGEFRDGAMRFSGVQATAEGDTMHQRLDFEAVAADTVRQIFRESRDGGETWQTTWVGLYIRNGAAPDSVEQTPGGAP